MKLTPDASTAAHSPALGSPLGSALGPALLLALLLRLLLLLMVRLGPELLVKNPSMKSQKRNSVGATAPSLPLLISLDAMREGFWMVYSVYIAWPQVQEGFGALE